MNASIIFITAGIAFAVAVVFGCLLGLFKKIFAVKTDPKVEQIRSVLSGGNCGGCGFAGCDQFAQAVANGKAPVNGCIAGGASCAKAIAKIMGADAGATVKKISVLACQGGCGIAKDKIQYEGVKTCAAVNLSANGIKACAYGCIGMGDCIEACPFGAIQMGKNGLPVVDREKCTGCGKCVVQCPKHLFKLVEDNSKGAIGLCSCKSTNKVQIKKDCSKGCNKCGLCVKKCPQKAIDNSTGLPVIDYTKCDGCGTCVKSCASRVFKLVKDL